MMLEIAHAKKHSWPPNYSKLGLIGVKYVTCCIVLSVGVAENDIRWILELDETTDEEISGVMDIFGFDYVTFLSFVSAMCVIM